MVASCIVGFWGDDVEVFPGVWSPEKIIEKTYKADIISDMRRFQPTSDQRNDIFSVNNRISILGDLYSMDHWASIKYVIWKNTRWKVTGVEVNYPRLILDLGGVYNENTT